ncbi:MAG TPA: response regulator [Isosphaeraceae bacterium]|jgi:CheY-like chemotaxis protein|nr:response regulator [Isosphaeraceae bacterium]
MTLDHPYSILITDDDPGSRESLREIFEPQGFRTLMAESGEEAIDIVRDEVVHIALMDMHLPRLTGLETMEIVRQTKGLLPMILISAERDDNLLRRALAAHAYSVLAKPLSKNLVIYVVTRALEKFYF